MLARFYKSRILSDFGRVILSKLLHTRCWQSADKWRPSTFVKPVSSVTSGRSTKQFTRFKGFFAVRSAALGKKDLNFLEYAWICLNLLEFAWICWPNMSDRNCFVSTCCYNALQGSGGHQDFKETNFVSGNVGGILQIFIKNIFMKKKNQFQELLPCWKSDHL